MGKTSAELQREIADHRLQMEAKIDRLQERVRTDVKQTGTSISDTIMERSRIHEYADKRPLTTLAGAFGAGILLGLVGPGMGGGSAAEQKRSGSSQAGSGLMGQLMGSASGMLSGTLSDEIKQMMDQVFGKDAAPAHVEETPASTAPNQQASLPGLNGQSPPAMQPGRGSYDVGAGDPRTQAGVARAKAAVAD